MKNQIAVTFDTGSPLQNLPLRLHILRCIGAALQEQGVPVPCEINVLVSDDETLRALNLQMRGIDRATDVLSFPMFSFRPGELPELSGLLDPETGLLPLGDMAISLERAKEQAHSFGHSIKREVGYLTVHSILHLLGYDHMDEGPMKKQMRDREDAICAALGMTR